MSAFVMSANARMGRSEGLSQWSARFAACPRAINECHCFSCDAQDPEPEEEPKAKAPKKEEPVETPPPAGFEWGKTA